MPKKLIGIVPTIVLNTNDDPYQDRYQFVNNYPKKVFKSGAVPLGILLNDGILDEESLKIYDAFIIPGGKKIDHNIYKIINYAYKNSKPILGVCMGMQALTIYSIMLDECQKRNLDINDEKVKQIIYDDLKENNPMLVKISEDKIQNHFHVATRTNIDEVKHEINILPNTILSEFYNKSKLNVVSLHSSAVTRVGSIFKINAMSEDNIIEGIENKEHGILGVQYHPEIVDDTLIEYFINNFVK